MNPRLMKPHAAGEYIAGMNSTTAEFINRLCQLKAAQPGGQSVQQLPLEINKFTMEGEVLLALPCLLLLRSFSSSSSSSSHMKCFMICGMND